MTSITSPSHANSTNNHSGNSSSSTTLHSAQLNNTGASDEGNNASGSGKGSNVQVVVRCRPVSESEKRHGDVSVLSCMNNNEVHLLGNNRAGKNGAKKVYTFDSTYSGNATQQEVYNTAVLPLVEEVLAGFNCTVCAYGQTGTGKTHTMEGTLTSDQESADAGVIPRAVHTIFDHIHKNGIESSVKVSFLELYNEELSDLLADENNGEERDLRIHEDPVGKRGMLVNNLEEKIVTSADEVFGHLQRSWQKRRTAETLLNKNSSRSHCVFIITVHTKEGCDEDGEDIIKVGKLYLVDLAGSECVGKSGARNQHAKEAGKINQSLLTLGRVINALVDKSGYVPYRDSKLTRLLQESLGGRAKTVIIATVSPALAAIDETSSTLEYAHRAKNIRNRPQINQKMTKRVYMKELLAEITSLKRDNDALRLKNGVFLPPEKYELMLSQQSSDKLQLDELHSLIKIKEQEIESGQMSLQEKEKTLDELTKIYESVCTQLQTIQDRLQETAASLEEVRQNLCKTQGDLHDTSKRLEAQQLVGLEDGAVIQHQARTEKELHSQAQELVATVSQVVHDTSLLHSKIDRKFTLEQRNAHSLATCTKSVSASHARALVQQKEFVAQHQSQITALSQDANSLTLEHSQMMDSLRAAQAQQDARTQESHRAQQHASSEFINNLSDHHGRVFASIDDERDWSKQCLTTLQTQLDVAQIEQHNRGIESAHYIEQQRSELESESRDRSMAATSMLGALSKQHETFQITSHAAFIAHQAQSQALASTLQSFTQAFVERAASERQALTHSIVELIAGFEARQSEAVRKFMISSQSQIEAHTLALQSTRNALQSQALEMHTDAQKWLSVSAEAAEAKACATAREFHQNLLTIQSSQSAAQATIADAQQSYIQEVQARASRAQETHVAEQKALAQCLTDSDHKQQALLSQIKSSQVTDRAEMQAWDQSVESLLRTKQSSIDSRTAAISGHVHQYVEQCAFTIGEMLHTVEHLAHDEWRTDVASGTTPEKRKVSFREQFASTRDHSQIRQQVRSQQTPDISPASVVDCNHVVANIAVNSALTNEALNSTPVLPSMNVAPISSSNLPGLSRMHSTRSHRSQAQRREGGGFSSCNLLPCMEADCNSQIDVSQGVNENTPPQVLQVQHSLLKQPSKVGKRFVTSSASSSVS